MISIVDNPYLNSIKFPQLETVGYLGITNASNMSGLQFPSLQTFGTIYLQELPNLQYLSFTPSNFRRRDPTPMSIFVFNTSLTSIQNWTMPTPQHLENFEISGNIGLEQVDASNFYSIKQLTCVKNGPLLNLNFSNLGETYHVEVKEISTVSFPALKEVKDSLEITDTEISKLDLPNLNRVDAHILIMGNQKLTTLNAPRLTNVTYNVTILDNPNLLIDEKSFEGLQYSGEDVLINAKLSG
jgi:Receptor L domain